MTNQNSFEEIVEIHSLLEDIKQEYTQGIRQVLQKIILTYLKTFIIFRN